MSIIPDKKVEQLQFCESHWPVWLAQFAGLGVSQLQIQNFKQLTQAARTAFDAAQAAKQAARAAVTNQDQALRAAITNAADLIRVIKSYAELTNNPDAVYALAQIPSPSAPTPALAPTRPINIRLQLESNGGLTIQWKAAPNSPATPDLDESSSGVTYSIYRRLPGESAMRIVGTATPPRTGAVRGYASWTDNDIPAGSNGITYAIQGARGELAGPTSDAFVVTLGMGGGGLTATMSPANATSGGGTSTVKMAA